MKNGHQIAVCVCWPQITCLYTHFVSYNKSSTVAEMDDCLPQWIWAKQWGAAVTAVPLSMGQSWVPT